VVLQQRWAGMGARFHHPGSVAVRGRHGRDRPAVRRCPLCAWSGLIFSILLVLVSVSYYNPKIMVERKPGIIDWFEGLVRTGQPFVAAAFLLLEVLGMTLL
jgi:hypothetical protein